MRPIIAISVILCHKQRAILFTNQPLILISLHFATAQNLFESEALFTSTKTAN